MFGRIGFQRRSRFVPDAVTFATLALVEHGVSLSVTIAPGATGAGQTASLSGNNRFVARE
jgi:hypothetical protein